METIIYLIRHAEHMKAEYLNVEDDLQMQNEKFILTVKGEEKAKELVNYPELKNLDYIASSDYVRAMQTAKYHLGDKLRLNLDRRFVERKHGVSSFCELPDDFDEHQLMDENYKIGNGESRKEVRERMLDGVMDTLRNNKGKKIAIFTHSNAIQSFLLEYCELDVEKGQVMYNSEVIIGNNMMAPEVFEIVFNDEKIKSIRRIRKEEIK